MPLATIEGLLGSSGYNCSGAWMSKDYISNLTMEILSSDKQPHEKPLDVVTLGLAGRVEMMRIKESFGLTKSSTPVAGVAPFCVYGWKALQCPKFIREHMLNEEGLKRAGPKADNSWPKPIYTNKKWDPHFEVLLGNAPDGTRCSKLLVTGICRSAVRAWNTYFAVDKSAELARTILNAKPANALFLTPWQCNLCAPPHAMKVVRHALQPELAKKQKRGRGKIFVLSVDFRQYYHMLSICEFLMSYMGLAMVRNGKPVYYLWGFCGMGFSWAVFAATSLGWFFMLHRNPVMPKISRTLVVPSLADTTTMVMVVVVVVAPLTLKAIAAVVGGGGGGNG
jgi:hypothetical protein